MSLFVLTFIVENYKIISIIEYRYKGGEKMGCKTYKSVPTATLTRLPIYYRYLINLQQQGEKNISSAKISADMNLSAVQVRKDLACVSSIAGKPKTGFDVDELIKDIALFLGYDNTTDAIIVGVGQLGRTLLSYAGFENYGLNIVAGFDSDEKIVNSRVNGKLIMPMEKLKNFVRRVNVHIGIITVPHQSAQEVCNELIDAGIKAIWNFAPTHIHVPVGVVLKDEDMASSLAILSSQLKDLYKGERIL